MNTFILWGDYQLTNQENLMAWLVHGEHPLNPLWEKKAYRYKFVLRSYLFYPKTLDWVKQLQGYHYLGYYLNKQTNLPCKLQRPYLSSAFSTHTAYDALCYNYAFFEKQSDSLITKLFSKKPLVLANLEGKNAEPIVIELYSEDRYSREGEFSVSARDSENNCYITLTFSIINYQGKSTLFIGGLQGMEHENGRELTQKITKSCYGLFPKRLAFEVVRQLAHTFQLQQIASVTNKTHIYQNWRYARKRKKVFADYDEFWLSMGATIDKRYLAILPFDEGRKPIEEVASKKRSEYRRRYALLDSMQEQIDTLFNKLAD